MRRFFILVFMSIVLLTGFQAEAENLPVRLHVRAEDDSKEAQLLKLRVRDEVLSCARGLIKGCGNEAEAYAALFSGIGEIRLAASKSAKKAGFEGEVNVYVKREYYPARLYGNTLMKEDIYPSVSVEIGKAGGKNWWCVIYPELCISSERNEETEIEFYSGLRTFFTFLFG